MFRTFGEIKSSSINLEMDDKVQVNAENCGGIARKDDKQTNKV